MSIRARLSTVFHRREKLPSLERPRDLAPPSWAAGGRTNPLAAPQLHDMPNRRSADAFGMGFIDGGGAGGPSFGDGGGGSD